MNDDIVDLEEKRIEKEYKETGMIKCNLPFELDNPPTQTEPKWWQKIMYRFTKADITPKEVE